MKKMIQKHQAVDLFAHGSTWLRADFHLHTKADNEFDYTGEDNAKTVFGSNPQILADLFYMKELTVSCSSSFMLCCVRWLDMAVYMKELTISSSSSFMLCCVRWLDMAVIKNLKSLLTWQTPNKFTIMYRGIELQHHSLGQRASALILFVLSQKKNDLVIIDQPADDLDNQTI